MALSNRLLQFFSPAPLGGPTPISPLAQQQIALAEATTRKSSGLGALSSPGLTHYGGFLQDPKERDAAWSTQFARDETLLEMQNNPILGGVLRQIAMFLRQVVWELDPADDSPEALEVRNWYKKRLDEMDNMWPGETVPQLLTFLVWGWSALEIIYSQITDLEDQKVGTIGWKEWRLIPQETRWRWEFNEAEEAVALIQLSPLTWKEIRVPLQKCIHIRDTSRNNSPEGFTLLRIVYDAYFYRNGFQQLEGTLFERYGGVQVARIPGNDIDGNTEAYRDLKQIVTTLGITAQSGLILSSDRDPTTNEYYQDFSIEAPAAGATVPSADPIINRYANEMVGVFGAAVTRTGQDGSGSYALADVQSEVFQRNMEAYVDLMQDSIQNQAFIRLAELPYNSIPRKLIPRLRHGKIDKVKLASLGAFLVELAQSGILEDTGELRAYVHEKADLPVRTAGEIQTTIDEEKAEAKASLKAQQASSQDGVSKGTKIESQLATAASQTKTANTKAKK